MLAPLSYSICRLISLMLFICLLGAKAEFRQTNAAHHESHMQSSDLTSNSAHLFINASGGKKDYPKNSDSNHVTDIEDDNDVSENLFPFITIVTCLTKRSLNPLGQSQLPRIWGEIAIPPPRQV
jgi:hypothetical protein